MAMLVTSGYDADSQASRHPLSRRNTATSETRWINYQPDMMPLASACEDHAPVDQRQKICFNVSGAIFETFSKTLERFPDTLLGSSELRSKYYESAKDEYFFNRNRESFESILFFYQSSGKLIKPANVGLKIFIEELNFFKMGDDIINCFIQKTRFQEDQSFIPDTSRNNIFGKIWNFLEHPKSRLGLATAFLSMTVICVSVVLFCMETMKPFRTNPEKAVLAKIEMFCVAWFTFELLLRFITSPSKRGFAKSTLNIVDLLAILPFYITLFSYLLRKNKKAPPLAFLRVIRLVRVVRIFKLSRHLRVFKILGMTFMSSLYELLLMLFFVCIAVILFASAVFYADKSFTSIPNAFWWAIITLTNVGYGDSVPKSIAGKIIGSCCAVCGIIVLALPIPIIVSSFMFFYNMDKENQQLEKIEAHSKKYSIMKEMQNATQAHRRLTHSHRVNPDENASAEIVLTVDPKHKA